MKQPFSKILFFCFLLFVFGSLFLLFPTETEAITCSTYTSTGNFCFGSYMCRSGEVCSSYTCYAQTGSETCYDWSSSGCADQCTGWTLSGTYSCKSVSSGGGCQLSTFYDEYPKDSCGGCGSGYNCSDGTCVPVCTPSWSCINWSPSPSSRSCGTTFTQTGTAYDSNNCGTTSGKPTCSRSQTGTYCSPLDCDSLDTTCRDYHDVSRTCIASSYCSSPSCSSYTNRNEGGSCGAEDKACRYTSSCNAWNRKRTCSSGSCSGSYAWTSDTTDESSCAGLSCGTGKTCNTAGSCLDTSAPNTPTINSPAANSSQSNNFSVSVSGDGDLGGSGITCKYHVYDSSAGWTKSWANRTCNSSFTVTVGPTGDCRTAGGTCTVYVFAQDGAGNTGGSATRAFKYEPLPACARPQTGLDCSYSKNTVIVSWNAVSGAASYRVEWCKSGYSFGSASCCPGGSCSVVTSNTSYTIGNLEYTTDYDIRVRVESDNNTTCEAPSDWTWTITCPTEPCAKISSVPADSVSITVPTSAGTKQCIVAISHAGQDLSDLSGVKYETKTVTANSRTVEMDDSPIDWGDCDLDLLFKTEWAAEAGNKLKVYSLAEKKAADHDLSWQYVLNASDCVIQSVEGLAPCAKDGFTSGEDACQTPTISSDRRTATKKHGILGNYSSAEGTGWGGVRGTYRFTFVECAADVNCPNACDTTTNSCVECTQDTHCTGGEKCDLTTNTCVDNAPPTITVNTSLAPWFNENPFLSVRFRDNINLNRGDYRVSGVWKQLPSAEDRDWKPIFELSNLSDKTTSFKIEDALWNNLADGTLDIYIRAYDDTGLEGTHSIAVKKDTTAPITRIEKIIRKITREEITTGWLRADNYEMYINDSDNVSGVQGCRYSVVIYEVGRGFDSWEGGRICGEYIDIKAGEFDDYHIEGDKGFYAIYSFAKDSAGNDSTSEPKYLWFDFTAPTIE